MSASSIVAYLSLIVSILGTLIIPNIKNRYDKQKSEKEYETFHIMIMKSYIIPTNKLIEKTEIGSSIEKYRGALESASSADKAQLKRMLRIQLASLNNLKENEIVYLNTSNQFKMVRLIEYVKLYFELSLDTLAIDINQLYLRPYDNELHIEACNIITKSKLIEIHNNFNNSLHDYINLKTNFILEKSNSEIVKETAQKMRERIREIDQY